MSTNERAASNERAATIIMWAIFGPLVMVIAGLILAGGYKAIAWVMEWGCP